MLLHINTHYYTLLRTGGFKLDFIAEGDVGTLDFNRFFLAIYFDGNFEKKLQTTIPDTVQVR